MKSPIKLSILPLLALSFSNAHADAYSSCLQNGGTQEQCKHVTADGLSNARQQALDACNQMTEPQGRAICLKAVGGANPEAMARDAAAAEGVPTPTATNICADAADPAACKIGVNVLENDNWNMGTRDAYIAKMCKGMAEDSAQHRECLEGLNDLKAFEAQGIPSGAVAAPTALSAEDACAGTTGVERTVCIETVTTGEIVDPKRQCQLSLTGEALARCIEAVEAAGD